MDSNLTAAVISAASSTATIGIIALALNAKNIEAVNKRLDRIEARLDKISASMEMLVAALRELDGGPKSLSILENRGTMSMAIAKLVTCPYYGKSGLGGVLIDTLGNQCAKVTTAHAPCQMELHGQPPNWDRCVYFNERWQRRELAMQLLGKMVRFAHQPDGPSHLCVLMDQDGMVEILGFTGLFAPHIFIVMAPARIENFP